MGEIYTSPDAPPVGVAVGVATGSGICYGSGVAFAVGSVGGVGVGFVPDVKTAT